MQIINKDELLSIDGGAKMLIAAPTYVFFMKFMDWLCSKLK